MSVGYRLASKPDDYRKAQALMKAEGVPKQELGFPTILAIEDKRAVGMISTNIQNDMVIAGPLVVRSDRRRVMTAIRMVEMYEMALRGMGLATFIFHVDEGTFLDRVIKRYGDKYQPYAVEGTRKFFVRRLTNGR